MMSGSAVLTTIKTDSLGVYATM
eukprot:COSAG04_NODE_29127_length_271_cov_0.598837_1_plen_22_part_10